MSFLGTCGRPKRYMVVWYEGNRIGIPALDIWFMNCTHDREEALAVCYRNLLDFVEG